MKQRAPKLQERLRANAARFRQNEVDALLALVEELSATPMPAMPHAWTHGDFYARHLLYHRGHLAGVIDWGDVHLGDPAVDLSIAFSFLPPEAREDFKHAYGEIGEATWQRAISCAALWRNAGRIWRRYRGCNDQGGWCICAEMCPSRQLTYGRHRRGEHFYARV